MNSTLIISFAITFFLILLACFGLGIGSILTGKSKLRKSCGGNFGQQSDKSCEKNKRNCKICGARGADDEAEDESPKK